MVYNLKPWSQSLEDRRRSGQRVLIAIVAVQTFVGSLIIIIAALVIEFTSFLEIDPLLGMAFGLLLFWASWSIILNSSGDVDPIGLAIVPPVV